MKVAVYGLGYVGSVTAGCLADQGHEIIGIDVQQTKVNAINAGFSPVAEPGLNDILKTAVANEKLTASADIPVDISEYKVHIICVGTPSLANGRLNLEFIDIVSAQIAEALKNQEGDYYVVYRSTILPGCTRSLQRQFFADSHIRVLYAPEFLREGSALADFKEPSLSVLGTVDGVSRPEDADIIQMLRFKGSTVLWEEAEMVKYSCNFFHALKVGFANEIGRLCKTVGMDAGVVMDAVCSDTRLNISTHYLKPGNAFGGSCLPKDLRALTGFSRTNSVATPLLESVMPSNQAHLESMIQLVEQTGAKRVGLFGLTFKANTDDLRGSPAVALAETLLGRGYELSIFDPGIDLTKLVGVNATEIQRRMPHLAKLLRTTAVEVVQDSEVIFVTQKCADVEHLRPVVRAEQKVVDAVGWRELATLSWSYEGVCW